MTLGNFTAPSLSRLFTRKDKVQYENPHFDDAAYLNIRSGARYGEILVPETWQGNFDGSDSVSDPVDWYSVDEFRMVYEVTRTPYVQNFPPFNPNDVRFPFTLTHSSPGRTSIVQTGEAGFYFGRTYDIPTNTYICTSILVSHPFSTGLIKMTPFDDGRFDYSPSVGDYFPGTITPDPPTENWLPRKGVWQCDSVCSFRGMYWGYVSGPADSTIFDIYAGSNNPTFSQIALSKTIGGAGDSSNVSQTAILKTLSTNPLWKQLTFFRHGLEGNTCANGSCLKLDLTMTRIG